MPQEITRKQWLEGLAARTTDIELLGALYALRHEAADNDALLRSVRRLAEVDDEIDTLKEKAKGLNDIRKGLLEEIKAIREALRSGPDLFDLAARQSAYAQDREALPGACAALLFPVDLDGFDRDLDLASIDTLVTCLRFAEEYADLGHVEAETIKAIRDRHEALVAKARKAKSSPLAAVEAV